MPATTMAYLVGAAGLTGLAPLGCFWCFGLLTGVLGPQAPFFAAVVLLTNFLTVVNLTRVYRAAFLGAPHPKTKRAPEVNWLMALPMVSLTVLVLLTPLVMVRIFGIVVVGTVLERIPHLNLIAIIVILGVFGWPPIARIARAEFLRLKEMEFVEAARCLGARTLNIIFRHILPNALPSLVVIIALGVGQSILLEAMISFLGFGDPKSVSWGQLLYFNYEHLKVSPWASIAPGMAIFITVLGFNLLADGMTDAFNPRLKE
mgnify:CR=1 FL=1